MYFSQFNSIVHVFNQTMYVADCYQQYSDCSSFAGSPALIVGLTASFYYDRYTNRIMYRLFNFFCRIWLCSTGPRSAWNFSVSHQYSSVAYLSLSEICFKDRISVCFRSFAASVSDYDLFNMSLKWFRYIYKFCRCFLDLKGSAVEIVILPMVVIIVISIIVAEAIGISEDVYPKIDGYDTTQMTTCK